eukprot:Skav210873  [mRNA]  locus=scaffold1173:40017:46040:+ [translate_table: standard]
MEEALSPLSSDLQQSQLQASFDGGLVRILELSLQFLGRNPLQVAEFGHSAQCSRCPSGAPSEFQSASKSFSPSLSPSRFTELTSAERCFPDPRPRAAARGAFQIRDLEQQLKARAETAAAAAAAAPEAPSHREFEKSAFAKRQRRGASDMGPVRTWWNVPAAIDQWVDEFLAAKQSAKSVVEGPHAAAKKQVLAKLNDLKKIKPEERAKEYRKLMRDWHPDKNLENKDLATGVFQFLQEQLAPLK